MDVSQHKRESVLPYLGMRWRVHTGLLQERPAAGPGHRGHQQAGQQALPPHTEDR